MSDKNRLTRLEIATYAFACALIIPGCVLARIDLARFENAYVVEDGFIEWLTVIGFALGALICFGRGVRLRRARPLRFIAVTTMIGLMCIFVAGEEISWGQRLLNFETASFFEDHNYQEETNLHNLTVGGVRINKLVFSQGIAVVGVLYFCVLSPVYDRKQRVRDWVDGMGIPIPKLHHFIACVLMLIVTQLLTPSSNRGELAEFGAAFLFALILARPVNLRIFLATRSPRRRGTATRTPSMI